MLVRIKVKAGWCRRGEGGHCWMGQVGLCTLFLTAGLAGPVKGGGLKVAGRRHWNTREKGTIQRERENTNNTNTVNEHAHTHAGPEIKMFDKKKKKKKKCFDHTPHWTKEEEKKKQENNFYIIYTDLSTFSIKDNLSVFWTVNLCQLQICTGDYTMWLSELSLSATCRYNKEESVCRCMHVMTVCEYAC